MTLVYKSIGHPLNRRGKGAIYPMKSLFCLILGKLDRFGPILSNHQARTGLRQSLTTIRGNQVSVGLAPTAPPVLWCVRPGTLQKFGCAKRLNWIKFPIRSDSIYIMTKMSTFLSMGLEFSIVAVI